MKIRAVATAILFVLAVPVYPQETRSTASISWSNVSSTYHRFEDIKPRLANAGTVSVFLSRSWPSGSAQMERLNNDSNEWEPGAWGITCSVASEPNEPIEIKPGSQRDTKVCWQPSTDRWEDPQHFVVADSRQQRPLDGRYRLVVLYALKPWVFVRWPSDTYRLVSSDFILEMR